MRIRFAVVALPFALALACGGKVIERGPEAASGAGGQQLPPASGGAGGGSGGYTGPGGAAGFGALGGGAGSTISPTPPPYPLPPPGPAGGANGYGGYGGWTGYTVVTGGAAGFGAYGGGAGSTSGPGGATAYGGYAASGGAAVVTGGSAGVAAYWAYDGSAGSAAGGAAGYGAYTVLDASADAAAVIDPSRIYCDTPPVPSGKTMQCSRPKDGTLWTCICGGGTASCTSAQEMPCTMPNCCGIDTSTATGCAAPPMTSTMTMNCFENWNHMCGQIRPGYGTFTACCPESSPYACPNGTPWSCFGSAAQARAECGDYCSKCVTPPD
jgi:hypothetical protein